MRHSFEAHSSSPNFSFACGIDGCPQTFKTFSAITSHLRRRHRGTELESAALALTSSEDQHCQSYESLDMELTEVSQEETLPHASMSIQVDCLQRSAALFLLCLKERYEVTAVDFAVGQVQQMVAYTVEDIQSSVKNCLIYKQKAFLLICWIVLVYPTCFVIFKLSTCKQSFTEKTST